MSEIITDAEAVLRALDNGHILHRLQYHESDATFDYDFDGKAEIADGVMLSLMAKGLVAFQVAMFGDPIGDYVLTEYGRRTLDTMAEVTA